MLRALELAEKGRGFTSPNPMVGAVLVRDGRIIGEGYHHGAGLPHAEVEACRDAEKRGEEVSGAEIFVTLEPCSSFGRTPPCTDLIIQKRIAKVTYGCSDPDPRHRGKADKILAGTGIEVCHASGSVAQKCRELNRAFFTRAKTGKPFVLLKMAETLDGKTAASNGSSKWITSETARKRVQYLRQGADAILCGINTVIADDPRMDVRDYPVRRQPRRLAAGRRMSAEQLNKHCTHGEFELVDISNWDEFLLRLGRENCLSLLIEGGGELAASALRAGAVDRIEFHIAPKILGGRGSLPCVGGENPESLDQAVRLGRMKILRLGVDFAVIADVIK